MLRAALDISWTKHITNIELYGNLPKITDTLKERRLRFIGHVWRKTDEMAQKLLLCEPMPGKRYSYMYVDQLRDNTGFEKKNLMEKMQNRKEWRSLVQYALASSSM